MKCFYHSADLDGKCSGALVKWKHPECELSGIDYGQPFPWHLVDSGECVWMVDFCLQPHEAMIRLAKMCDLVWIDHHKTSIELQEKLLIEIAGIREIGRGGCELVWEYFGFNDVFIPGAVLLLGRYDVGDLDFNESVLPFQYGMRLEETNPENQAFWVRLFKKAPSSLLLINDTVMDGEIVLKYIEQDDLHQLEAGAFETDLAGMKCLGLNRLRANSRAFKGRWDPAKYQVMLSFGWHGGYWTVLLFTDREDVDVSVVAKSFGGGGHKNAAGFTCEKLPFDLPASQRLEA